MIKTEHVTKHFGDVVALNTLNCQVPKGSIYGLIGSNGAGKSTLLRLIAGILKPTSGRCLLDNQLIYEQPATKQRIVLVPDAPAFLPQATLRMMIRFYQGVYLNFDRKALERLQKVFPLDPNKRLSSFSKGMQRQAALTLAIASKPDVLLLDEAFDGLDPVMRQALKHILTEEVVDRELTVIISSHNLRELEDFCDHVGLLHRGGLVFEEELNDVKLGLSRIQVAFTNPVERKTLEEWGLNLLQYRVKGSVLHLVLKEIVSRPYRFFAANVRCCLMFYR